MGSLLQSGINCVQLVGDMTINARDAAIKKFTDDPDCKIFLVSLKAGGIALNLTVASHVSCIFYYMGYFLYGISTIWLSKISDSDTYGHLL